MPLKRTNTHKFESSAKRAKLFARTPSPPVSNDLSNPQPANEKYTVGWICAVYKEFTAALVFLDEEHEGPESVAENDNNSYRLGKMGDHNIVIAAMPDGEYGTTSAASVARDMLHSFPNVRIGLMVGIGGGVPSAKHDIRLGDIVVSSPRDGHGGVFQYDFGRAIQDQQFQETRFLDQPPAVLRSAVTNLRAQYERHGHQIQSSTTAVLDNNPRMRKKYGQPAAGIDRLYKADKIHADDGGDCATVCGDTAVVPRATRQDYGDGPMIHYGLIASGNQLMKNAAVRDALARQKDVLCFEMEAAGLMNHFPCLIIRGICDYSDTHKNDAWQGYAAMVAAAYAKDLLQRIPPNKVEAEKRLGEVVHAVSKSVREVHEITTEARNTIASIHADNRLDKIRNWLAPPDPSTNLKQARELHHQGTGQWFLNSTAYSIWKTEPQSFLWLHGIPGCGKTILSSTIITDLECNRNTSTVLYFFFDFNDIEKKSLEKAIHSLIFQLYLQCPSLQAAVDTLYLRFENWTKRPDAALVQNLFQDMLQQLEEVYMVLDALDESSTTKSLLSWVNQLLTGRVNIHLLVTSRPEHDILAAFKGWTDGNRKIQLQSELIGDDIAAYVSARTREFRRWKKRPDVQAEIETTLLQKANGMFRWIQCQLDVLDKCLDPPSIKKALANLPKNLDETYERIVQQIHPDHKNTAIRLLQFLVYSERPLTLNEAVELIAVNPLSRPAFITEDRMPIPEEIIAYCSSLITLVQREATPSELFRFGLERIPELHIAHFSVKEYLISNRLKPDLALQFQEIPAKACIADVCISYLLATHQLYLSKEAVNEYYLTRFSAQYWMEFAKDVEISKKEIIPSVKEYLSGEKAFQFGYKVHQPDHDISSWKEHVKIQALYYVSWGGLLCACHFLLDEGDDVNARGGRYGNALQAASVRGHLEIAKLLLEKGADVNARGGRYGSALQASSVEGHLDIAKLLLDNGADPNAQGGKHSNALHAASVEGHLEIAKLLLDNGADINTQSEYYGNALHAASAQGHLDIAKLLLGNGADANAQSGLYGNALQTASVRGHPKIAKLLLDNGADVNAQGGYYNNALQAASVEGHLDIAKLLLDNGAYINTQGGKYGNTLQAASVGGYLAIVKLLLEKGADANAQSGLYGSALQAASVRGYLEIAKLLLDNSADVNAQGGYYGNALQAASVEGHLDIARLLLDNGADANAQGGEYGNAFQAALVEGHLDIAKLLLKKGADVNAQGGEYGNALQAASVEGHLAIVKLLLGKGADINAQGGYYGNALQAASVEGHLDIAKLLLEKGADANAQGGEYGNAFQAASVEGHLEIADLLLDKGAIRNLESYKYPILHAILGQT